MKDKNKIVEMIPYSFTKDMIIACALGLNVGFIIGIIMVYA